MSRSPFFPISSSEFPRLEMRLCALVLPLLLLGYWLLAPLPVHAEEKQEGKKKNAVKVVTILLEDEEGAPLRFPSAVAYDRDQEEIYVNNGGSGGIVIYDREFFPHLSLGAGRGINSPQGIFFDREKGDIFICQGKSHGQPARLTILNGAFLPEREITFKDMPDQEASQFAPIKGAIGKDNIIYLVGSNTRGVMKIDKRGNFLGWLRPMDFLLSKTSEAGADKVMEEMGGEEPPPPPSEEEDVVESELIGLPAELLPKSKGRISKRPEGEGQKPIRPTDIVIDREGHIFVLSEETSKVYVFGANEELLYSFGQKGGSSGKMSRPRGLALDEESKVLYVVDYMRHTVLVYDTGGKYVYEFGGRGNGPLWYNFPTDIAVDRWGRIIVADLFNNRIQILKAQFDIAFPYFGKQGKDGPTREKPRLKEMPQEKNDTGK